MDLLNTTIKRTHEVSAYRGLIEHHSKRDLCGISL